MKLQDLKDRHRARRDELENETLDRPRVFEPLGDIAENARRSAENAAVQANLARMELEDDIEENEKRHRPKHIPRANRVIAVLIICALVVGAVNIVVGAMKSYATFGVLFQGAANAPAIVGIVYLLLMLVAFAALIMLIRLDRAGRIYSARIVARVLVFLLLGCVLLCVALNGLTWFEVTYLFEFVCVIAYQVYNDPNLDRSVKTQNPFKRSAYQDDTYEHSADRTGYIPLNFFNLFWIFVVASVLGLVMETAFCGFADDNWGDRAGFLWGPFSPIYGVGAALMTIALNRIWNKPGIVIFLIAGLIGAAFEYFVAWYMETAFGIVAWSYEGTFLSIHGRTDFAHFLAWGAVGLVWMRLLLPMVLRFVDLIALRWRAIVTVLMFAFMLTNGVMTLLALDCWSQRLAGYPVENSVQVYFAEHYDDEFMQTRFSTMGINGDGALRAQEARAEASSNG